MSQFNFFLRLLNWSILRTLPALSFALVFLGCPSARAATSPVPRWERMETTLQSSVTYGNPAQEASLEVTFVSPAGRNVRVYGFWDGASTWRIRFAPNEAGKWTYKTVCSDQKNTGLHGKTGEFTCV